MSVSEKAAAVIIYKAIESAMGHVNVNSLLAMTYATIRVRAYSGNV